MNEKSYPRIGETVLEKTLPNGLKIFIVPKPQHRKKYAFFATRYGGMDMQFIRNGEKCDTPAGIAHYLEHKMFDTKDGNALQVLSQNGAEPNAFTSNAMTGYYFDCTEHFEENLRILLSFVSVPYFTDESVEKERGIIGQEIRMVEDSPDWQVYERLLACLYRSSPARVPIAGTVESIAGITAETLYDCHHAFYCPSNMALCVVGNVDPHTVIALAEEVLPRERGEEIARCYGEEEDDAAAQKETVTQMEVALPQFLVGFKCETNEGDLLRQSLIGEMASDVLLGDSSPLYQRLYDEGLINSSFGGGFDQMPGVAVLCAGGESERAATVMRPRRSCAPFWTRRSASRARAATLTFSSRSAARASARRCARSTRLKISPSPWRTATSAASMRSGSPRRTRASKKRMSSASCAKT